MLANVDRKRHKKCRGSLAVLDHLNARNYIVAFCSINEISATPITITSYAKEMDPEISLYIRTDHAPINCRKVQTKLNIFNKKKFWKRTFWHLLILRDEAKAESKYLHIYFYFYVNQSLFAFLFLVKI